MQIKWPHVPTVDVSGVVPDLQQLQESRSRVYLLPSPTPFKRLPGNISRLKRCIFQNVNKKLHILVLAWVKVTLLLFYEQERRVARQKELLGAGEKINGGFSVGLARRRKAIQDVTCQGCAQDSSPALSQSFLPSDFHKLPEGSRQLFFETLAASSFIFSPTSSASFSRGYR